MKFASPLYVAVNVLVPAEVLGKLQVVPGKVIVQFVAPSETKMVPVSVPAPGLLIVTPAVTV